MKGKSIDVILTFVACSANGIPRGRGVRGAARGLERELKGIEAAPKKTIEQFFSENQQKI
jgi:hypothetical protein